MRARLARLAVTMPWIALGAAWLPAQAQPEDGRLALAAFRAGALADEALDQVRGGFTAPGGLQVSFGIERAVYINGELVPDSVFRVGTMGGLGEDGRSLPSGQLLTVQNGPGNLVVSGAAGAGLSTVIQNTLDAQKIQSLTVINATTNSLQMMKGLQLQSTLNDAIAASLRR